MRSESQMLGVGRWWEQSGGLAGPAGGWEAMLCTVWERRGPRGIPDSPRGRFSPREVG